MVSTTPIIKEESLPKIIKSKFQTEKSLVQVSIEEKKKNKHKRQISCITTPVNDKSSCSQSIILEKPIKGRTASLSSFSSNAKNNLNCNIKFNSKFLQEKNNNCKNYNSNKSKDRKNDSADEYVEDLLEKNQKKSNNNQLFKSTHLFGFGKLIKNEAIIRNFKVNKNSNLGKLIQKNLNLTSNYNYLHPTNSSNNSNYCSNNSNSNYYSNNSDTSNIIKLR